jgi:hypothetical protein
VSVSALRLHWPSAFDGFACENRTVLWTVIDIIAAVDGVRCAFWGGSSRFLPRPAVWADIDIWVILDAVADQPAALRGRVENLPSLAFVHEPGHLPWFGHLLSLFFFPGCTFAVDVGLCTGADLPALNPGANPALLLGEETVFHEVCSALRPQHYRRNPKSRAEKLLANLLKTRKSLTRGHFWNAIECLSRARHEMIGIIVQERSESRHIYYVRPERDAEDYLDYQERRLLAATAPRYDAGEIAAAACSLADYAARHAQCPDIIARELRHLVSELTGWSRPSRITITDPRTE